MLRARTDPPADFERAGASHVTAAAGRRHPEGCPCSGALLSARTLRGAKAVEKCRPVDGVEPLYLTRSAIIDTKSSVKFSAALSGGTWQGRWMH
jgi:hypothetical protein